MKGDGSSHCGSALTSPTSIHEDVGSIPSLAQWVGAAGVAMRCHVGGRCSSDLVLLWLCLWLWLGAAAPIGPSLGTSICHGCGPTKKKRKKERSKTQKRKGQMQMGNSQELRDKGQWTIRKILFLKRREANVTTANSRLFFTPNWVEKKKRAKYAGAGNNGGWGWPTCAWEPPCGIWTLLGPSICKDVGGSL